MTGWQRLMGTRISCAIFRAHRACYGLPCDCRCHDDERTRRLIIEREMSLYGEVLSRSLLDDSRLREHAAFMRMSQRVTAALKPRPNPSVKTWR